MDYRELVSVVVPTHDRPDRLHRAVAAVLAQTHGHLELIVVDDASRVAARDVVEAVAAGDDRVRVIRSDLPLGAARARNLAMAEAKGSIVAFLDDDDTWVPQKIERQLAVLRARPEVGLLSCDYRIVDEGRGGLEEVYRGPRTYSARHLEWANLVGSFSFVLARRDLLGDELVIDEDFPSAEDWDLWLRCARRAPVAVVEEVLATQVFHGGPRLSDPASERAGLRAFLEKHSATLTPAGRAYHEAHIRMEQGTGWAKRRSVLRSLAAPSPMATAVLVTEQVAHAAGRVRHDPGFSNRVLVRFLDRFDPAGR